MKKTFTPLFFLLITLFSSAQSLTGIWRGQFVSSSMDMRTGGYRQEKYKYEVQINNLTNNSIEGVTYSYKDVVFYGKATMQGIYTKKTKNLILQELKLVDVKISENSSACPMTCYLDYKKLGKQETLIGTYTSVNEKGNGDCGSGTVYLEKVTDTEFKKEAFLLKKPKISTTAKNTVINNKQNATSQKKATFKPGAEEFMVKKESIKKVNAVEPKIDTTNKKKIVESIVTQKDKPLPKIKIPDVFADRDNILATTLVVDDNKVRIEFLDNGQIDNDSITVYHNNKIVLNPSKLSYVPLILNIEINASHPDYELIIFANNLGILPPNTALMIVTSGTKRYEVNVASDEKNNAKVILHYQPKG